LRRRRGRSHQRWLHASTKAGQAAVAYRARDLRARVRHRLARDARRRDPRRTARVDRRRPSGDRRHGWRDDRAGEAPGRRGACAGVSDRAGGAERTRAARRRARTHRAQVLSCLPVDMAILAAVIVAAALIWGAVQIAREIASARSAAARGRTLQLLELFTRGIAAADTDPR